MSPIALRPLLGGLLATGALLGSALAPAPAAVALTSSSELLSAQAPSMCANPAGRLINGQLPNIPGHVSVDLTTSTLGTLVSGDGVGAVATFHCDAGGVSWGDHVVFYNSTGAIIGDYDTETLGSGGRARISQVSVDDGIATVRVVAASRSDDNNQWGSTGVRLRFSYDDATQQMKLASTKWYTEKASAKLVMDLLKHRLGQLPTEVHSRQRARLPVHAASQGLGEQHGRLPAHLRHLPGPLQAPVHRHKLDILVGLRLEARQVISACQTRVAGTPVGGQ